MSEADRPRSRLRAAALRLLGQQMESGAWGQRPDSERGNTIATAQALKVLRRAGIPAWDEGVEKGARYLAAHALEHAKEVEEGGRGPYVRYVIHSLAGLLEFDQLPTQEALISSRKAQLDWLLERQTYGGWADSPPDPISTLATAQALRVVRRAGAPRQAIEDAADYLVAVRHPQGYWRVSEWEPQSPGVTAECMLALRGLSAEIDAQLERCANWLDANRRLWLRQVEAQPISGETWHLPTFALVEQALAAYGPELPGGTGSLVYLEELWDEAECGWRFPGEVQPSPKGAVMAIACFEAVLAASALDEAAAALSPPELPVSTSLEEEWEIELLARPDARVRIGKFEQLLPFRRRHWDILDALEQELDREEGGFLERDRIAVAVGLSPKGSISKEMTRLNEFLAKKTGGRVNRVVAAAGSGRWQVSGQIKRRAAAELLGTGAQGPDGLDGALD